MLMSHRFAVTGGAGFIGTNYAARLLARGAFVRIVDNLSRAGARHNLNWLGDRFGTHAFEFAHADVRDAQAMARFLQDVDRIVHLAAQVAVTTSIAEPRRDFETNALGTLNVLEAARVSTWHPRVLFTSTNKVYGPMPDLPIVEHDGRYAYADGRNGIAEDRPLDFHSPYGCSKGAADQYVRDYSRIYGIHGTVFRMSCIYGPRQFGIEDQGWIAWLLIAAITGRPISIFGDGKQVRDVLFIDDLLDAFDLALETASPGGEVFNIGGGSSHKLAVWRDLQPLLEELLHKRIEASFHNWRVGDQRLYVSDISKAQHILGWRPKIDPPEGVRRLHAWVLDNRQLFA